MHVFATRDLIESFFNVFMSKGFPTLQFFGRYVQDLGLHSDLEIRSKLKTPRGSSSVHKPVKVMSDVKQ